MELERFHLDKNAPLPLAEQLSNEILCRIMSGELRAGEKLPTERDLAEHLGIARGTVKRAYARLQHLGAIDARQGSGSYVQKNAALLEETQKKEAAELLAATIARLHDVGMNDKEIWNLMRLQLHPQENDRKIAVMVLSNNHGVLSELEAQLSYLTSGARVNYALSFMTIPNISATQSPVGFLLGYDLIVTTSIDYPATLALVPMLKHKVIEGTIAPRTRTLVELGNLPRDGKISIVYRTPVFLNMVQHTLSVLGFDQTKIEAYQEDAYTPELHGGRGEAAVIGFNEAPMYTQRTYKAKNERFIAAGGRIIHFEYRIDRASLSNIEDRISDLLSRTAENSSAPSSALFNYGENLFSAGIRDSTRQKK